MNLSYSVGREKLDYPSLCFFFLFFFISFHFFPFRSICGFRVRDDRRPLCALETTNFERSGGSPSFAHPPFRGSGERRIEKVGLYAFFTPTQEPRPCPGLGSPWEILSPSTHGRNYEMSCVSSCVVFEWLYLRAYRPSTRPTVRDVERSSIDLELLLGRWKRTTDVRRIEGQFSRVRSRVRVRILVRVRVRVA